MTDHRDLEDLISGGAAGEAGGKPRAGRANAHQATPARKPAQQGASVDSLIENLDGLASSETAKLAPVRKPAQPVASPDAKLGAPGHKDFARVAEGMPAPAPSRQPEPRKSTSVLSEQGMPSSANRGESGTASSGLVPRRTVLGIVGGILIIAAGYAGYRLLMPVEVPHESLQQVLAALASEVEAQHARDKRLPASLKQLRSFPAHAVERSAKDWPSRDPDDRMEIIWIQRKTAPQYAIVVRKGEKAFVKMQGHPVEPMSAGPRAKK